MRGAKAGRRWEALVGYTIDDLITHMRRQLPRKYTMDDFHNGRLHIDHIIPKSAFDCSSEDGVRQAWSLPNLRPLPAQENLRKNAKRLHLL